MLLLHLNDVDEARWKQRLENLLGDYPIVCRNDPFDPALIKYIFVWKPEPNAFDDLVNLQVILSLGAGVDALMGHSNLPTNIPIVRFVDDELTQCMSDYVVANVSMHHRCFSQYRDDQQNKNWTQFYPPPSWDISVGVMGLGVLGQDSVKRLMALGYDVKGWSRNQKSIDSMKSFAGAEQFDSFLSETDILVDLLPLTKETTGILNYKNFSKLRRTRLKDGPALVNAARGGHQIESDIVRALEDGTLGAASLDVFEQEPLPADSPLWNQKNCYVTPHIAAISNPESGASYFARVLRDHEAGKPLVNVVDITKGY